MVEKEIPIAKDYYAREDGAIISKKHGKYREISQHFNKQNGYYTVRIAEEINKPKTFNVHKLIAVTFIGVCPKGMEVRHIDGNSKNNNPNNLEYGTRLENHSDKIRHGTSGKGSKNSMAKLTEKEVLEIRSKYIHGKRGCGYIALGNKYGISSGNVKRIVTRKMWQHI